MDERGTRMNIEKILAEADKYDELCVKIRRDFHKYAELSWLEFRTTSKIMEFLMERGIPVSCATDVVNPEYVWSFPSKEVLEFHKKRAIEQGANPAMIEKMGDYTGCMAVIETGKPGPVIAIRADIDCNDIGEAEDDEHRPYREGFASVNPKFMHACGHDGHAAMAMITAAILNDVKEELCGTIKVIFQPGEEGDKGAKSVAESGILDDVDYIMANHILHTDGEYPALRGAQKGLLSTTKFDVAIHGKASHSGAAPQEGNNAILAAVMAIGGMTGFLQDGRGMSRLNVGVIQGGTGRNVVPESCFFKAETRGETTEMEQRLYNRAVACVKGACEAYECTFDTTIVGGASAVEADADLIKAIGKAAEVVPELKSIEPVYQGTGGTDDFNFLLEKVQSHGGKGSYMALLTRQTAGNHNNYYDFDECCLKAGVKVFLANVCYLMEHEV